MSDTTAWVIGGLILANLGTIVTCMFAAFRVVWWASSMNARVEVLERDVHKIRGNCSLVQMEDAH